MAASSSTSLTDKCTPFILSLRLVCPHGPVFMPFPLPGPPGPLPLARTGHLARIPFTAASLLSGSTPGTIEAPRDHSQWNSNASLNNTLPSGAWVFIS